MSIQWDNLKDRSVIITGGASGLGEATAKKFYENGAYITIADLQDDLGNKLVKELGDRATFVHCNTTDWDSLTAAFKHAANFAPSKTIDIAILYAGVDGERRGLVDLVMDQPEPSLDGDPTPAKPAHRALDINLDGVYISTYLALHYFRLPAKNGAQNFKKSLILISSITGYMDLPYNTGYATSKYAVRGMFRSIRSATSKVNARVNNIAPGFVLTPLTKKVHQIE
jgi:5'-hydroxyaverantin dehydrogenase